MQDRLDDLGNLMPYLLGLLTTVLALKKEWIMSKFTKKEKALEVASTIEDVEAKALKNVETSMLIYRGMVEDLQKNIEALKVEVLELKEFIVVQKAFITKQSKSLQYYEKKYGN
tara:strand:+ start:658 stop:999 length:342 start_codon:yes stop_codon:yes gene_type:complete